MILWFIVGSILWALCILLMLAVFHGGNRIRGNGYEQKLYFRSMVHTQNIFDKKRSEEDYKDKKDSMSAHICQ